MQSYHPESIRCFTFGLWRRKIKNGFKCLKDCLNDSPITWSLALYVWYRILHPSHQDIKTLGLVEKFKVSRTFSFVRVFNFSFKFFPVPFKLFLTCYKSVPFNCHLYHRPSFLKITHNENNKLSTRTHNKLTINDDVWLGYGVGEIPRKKKKGKTKPNHPTTNPHITDFPEIWHYVQDPIAYYRKDKYSFG